MPISHSHKCVFVHIPRTSGTSTEQLLGMRNENNTVDQKKLYGKIPSQLKQKLSCCSNYYQHLTWREITQISDPRVIETYSSFAVIRNPWDRLVSCYFNMDPDLVCCAREKGIELEGKSFSEFVEVVENINHVHLLAQYEFVKANSSGRDLDRVFRFESLSEYIRFLWGGLGKETPYPNLKSTGRLHYREYYDVELRERVAVRYKQDIELFGYEF